MVLGWDCARGRCVRGWWYSCLPSWGDAREEAPDGVEAQRRGDVLFLLNHSDRAAEVAGVVGADLLSGQSCTGHVIVPPRSALVVHHPPNTQASSSSTTLI